MTDIVQRLRSIEQRGFGLYDSLLKDAAEEIERLRAELARANSPVVDCRNSHEGERFRPAECGGFQGHED